ncbi:MAG: 16S rRNA (adenine(1518)-N(6)/adenine(1519)-N(6))-dimethyltransferase RsmA [Aquificaceae bacterium]
MKLKKHLGQHLLVASGVLDRIAQFIDPKEGDLLLEIGPGTGNLTKKLLTYNFKELHLLEIDPDMIRSLKESIKDPRVVIHNADAVSFDFCSLGESLKVFGNLPYNVASLIVENTVFHHRCIPQAIYMLQKEVAEKIQRGPSWLSSFVRTFYKVEYLMSIPSRFFYPKPKVQSGLIRLTRKDEVPKVDLKDYKNFLTRLYSMRRKALKHKLPKEVLFELSIDPLCRIESLDPEKLLLIYNIHQKVRGDKR